MTLPAVIRVFFAIDLPSSVKQVLANYLFMLKKTAKTNAIRWTKPENLHITLQFLAMVKSEDLPALITHVKSKLSLATNLPTLQIAQLHLFPSPFKPRVIVLDVQPQQVLAELATQIGEGIIAAQYEIDGRPFRGHLTLGRIKHPQATKLEFLGHVVLPEVPSFELREVVLFRSQPQANGSQYTSLIRLDL